MVMIAPSKEIKEHIGRAKALNGRRDTMKSLFELCEGLKKYIQHMSKIFGPEKTELEFLFKEVLQSYNSSPELRPFLDAPLSLARGQEKALHGELVATVKRILQAMKQEGVSDEERKRNEAQERREKLLTKLQDFLRAKDMVKAGGQIKRILEEHETDPSILVDLAESYYKTGFYKEAIEIAEKAMLRSPEDQVPYKVLVNCLRNLKEYAKAEQVYLKALKVFGQQANIYQNLAKLYIECSASDRAMQAASMAKKLDPDNPEIDELLAEIGQAN